MWPDDDKVVRFELGIPGHHHIEGTDLEVEFNRHGDDLGCPHAEGLA